MRELHPEAIRLIRHYEGFTLEAYRCPAGFWTNDTGNLITRDINAPKPPDISEGEARELFRKNTLVAIQSVLRLISIPLTDGQFGALVDFTFNLGGGALQASTLRRRVNEGRHEEATREFAKWVYAGGIKLRGLVVRRKNDSEMYMSDLAYSPGKAIAP